MHVHEEVQPYAEIAGEERTHGGIVAGIGQHAIHVRGLQPGVLHRIADGPGAQRAGGAAGAAGIGGLAHADDGVFVAQVLGRRGVGVCRERHGRSPLSAVAWGEGWTGWRNASTQAGTQAQARARAPHPSPGCPKGQWHVAERVMPVAWFVQSRLVCSEQLSIHAIPHALIRRAARLRAADDDGLQELARVDGVADHDAVMRLIFHASFVSRTLMGLVGLASRQFAICHRIEERHVVAGHWSVRRPLAEFHGRYLRRGDPGHDRRRIGRGRRLFCRALLRATACRKRGDDEQDCSVSHCLSVSIGRQYWLSVLAVSIEPDGLRGRPWYGGAGPSRPGRHRAANDRRVKPSHHEGGASATQHTTVAARSNPGFSADEPGPHPGQCADQGSSSQTEAIRINPPRS